MSIWNPNSWSSKNLIQHVAYPSPDDLHLTLEELKNLPPLITYLEIETLKKELREAALGHRFLLQGGDCAESFSECSKEQITNKLKIILQMSLILVHGLKRPITRIGRIAGQYAKPRSEESETVQGVTLPSYRGDIINSSQFSLSERTPDPRRMLKAYHYSAMTLNHLRTLINNGFADLHHPEYWNLNFSLHPSLADKYHTIEHAVKHTENLTENINFYTSHEALLLPYEEAMTQQAGPNKVWYNLGTHFPWVGMRTAKLDSAHIEYLRGIANPIAIKVGPEMHEDYLIKLIDVLNPQNEPGRLTLIHRLGAEKISETLPRLINAVKTEGKIVLWSCDPMHGNTRITRDGIKTRKFDDILLELTSAFQIHQHMGTYLGGIHVELTGEDVTECTGGARGLTDDDLKHAYQSQVDPRLNYEQSLEMAMLIVQNQG